MEMGALDVPVIPSGARDLEARAARRTAAAATRPARSLDRKVGMAMQSYLYRTPKDVASLLPLQPVIRLVKGAYNESPEVAANPMPHSGSLFARPRRGVWICRAARRLSVIPCESYLLRCRVHSPFEKRGGSMKHDARLVLFAFVLILAAATAHAAVATASISGTVFNDTNGNGTLNPGETGIAGVTVTLDAGADNTVDATTTTDINGNYSFTLLLSGTYRIRQVVPLGKTQSSPNPPDVVLVAPTSVSGVNFGDITTPIPALSTWMLALLALTMGVIALKR